MFDEGLYEVVLKEHEWPKHLMESIPWWDSTAYPYMHLDMP